MKTRVLSIGDIHGRDTWKFITHGSSYEFDLWRTMVEAGATPDDESFKDDYPFMGVDKIVFVGDYVDSFTITNVVIKKNLEDIVWFKKMLPDKVILLWGNHDVQYFIPNQICSGYRPEAKYDLEDIFRENRDLFQMAYHNGDYLWTHAGLVKQILRALLKNKEYDFLSELKSEGEVLNEAFKHECHELFAVDRASGGWSTYGGPLWVRPKMLAEEAVDLHQIVGHTPQKKLLELKNKRDYNIWFIDYIEYGDDDNIVPFILEI